MELAAWLSFIMILPVISGEFKVVDLTWNQGPDQSVYWPGNPSMNFSILYRGNTTGNFWYESNWFSTAEHGSTHLDSPSHFFKGGWRVHEIPPERLIGPAVVIDVKDKVKNDPDYRVDQSDFEDYEDTNGPIPRGAIVLMNSGWSPRYPNPNQIFNTEQPDNATTFHFPGFHQDGIEWLLDNRNVSMIGVDTPSIDYGQSTDFKVHILVSSRNVPGLENVANLDSVPAKGATISAGVIKLYQGSGGPVRILAMYDDEAPQCDCTTGGGSDVVGMTISMLVSFVNSLFP